MELAPCSATPAAGVRSPEPHVPLGEGRLLALQEMKRLVLVVLVPFLILTVAWTQELVDQLVFAGQWNLPMRQGGSILGVLTAPFSHSGFGHLLSNSLWFLPLSCLVMAKRPMDYLAVWVGVLVMALPVWLFWPSASHGLSGVVYGLLGYLLLIGWLEQRFGAMVLSLLCLFSYGDLLPSLVPFLSPPGVSWIGHAAGFAGGVLATLAIHREPPSRERLR